MSELAAARHEIAALGRAKEGLQRKLEITQAKAEAEARSASKRNPYANVPGRVTVSDAPELFIFYLLSTF